MKSLRKSLALCLVLCLVIVCFTGCMNIDMGVELKEDGTATLSSKLMIEESAYNTLLSFETSDDFVDSDEEGLESTEATEDTDATEPADGKLDLKSFQKEVINDEVFYTYEQTMDVASYEELEKLLVSNGDEEGVDLFSDVKIAKESNSYLFQATTAVMDNTEETAGLAADDWLTLSLTVTLPGKIVETSGEKLDENTVRFVLNDFTDVRTLSVASEVSVFGLTEIVVCAVCGGIIVGAIVFLIVRKKKGHHS